MPIIHRDEVLTLLEMTISESGGFFGIRDEGMLDSAIHAPCQSFGGVEAFPSDIQKIAALTRSIIKNHPFVDGNKRVGFLVIPMLLEDFGYAFSADEDDAVTFIESIAASSRLSVNDIEHWIIQHSATI